MDLGNLVPKETIGKFYDDAVAPAAKQVGKFGEDVAKTARLILSPLQVTAAFGDRLEAMIDRLSKRVPEERRVEPPAEIVGPVIDHLRFVDEGSPLSSMFEELLCKAIDRDGQGAVHPAFAQLVKQLSRDEAWLLYRLKQNQFRIIDRVAISMGRAGERVEEESNVPLHEIFAQGQLNLYVNHLTSAGLIQWPVTDQTPIVEMGRQTGVRRVSFIQLTDLGRMFVDAAIPAEGFERYAK